jgi:hypothetical protein
MNDWLGDYCNVVYHQKRYLFVMNSEFILTTTSQC